MTDAANWFTQPLPVHRPVYVCDWLPPDFGAVGQYSLQFCRERAERGEDVLLIGFSSQQSSLQVQQQSTGRLTILRLKVGTYNKARLTARMIWTLKINLRLMLGLLRTFIRADEIIFTGSPPFMVHWVAPLNLLLRKQVVYRITDFYPECLMATRPQPGLLLSGLYRLTMFWRRRIPVMEILGEDQRLRLLEAGISADRIRLKRDPSPIRIPPDTVPLPLPEALQGRCVLLYSGNFGVAHDYQTFVEAYIRHHQQGSGRVVLWLNAVGSAAGTVETALNAADVPVVRGKPVPLEQLPALLVTPHAHLITLRNEFMGFVMPSKVYGCIESGRSVLYIGPETSDVHLLCQQGLSAEHYHRVAVGDVESACHRLEALADQLMSEDSAAELASSAGHDLSRSGS